MRMSHILVISATSLLMAGMSALAQDAQQAPANSDPDQIVCRDGDAVTGTRIRGARICHTQREWDDIRRQARDIVAHSEMKGAMGNSKGNGG